MNRSHIRFSLRRNCRSRKVSVSVVFQCIFASFNSTLDIFKFDPKYLENEEKYKAIKAEILGEDSDEESGSDEESSDEDDEEGGTYTAVIFLIYF